MLIETRAVPPFNKDGFVVGCDVTRQAVLIDPGDEVDMLLNIVTREKLEVKYLLLTHAHLDHITGVARAKKAAAFLRISLSFSKDRIRLRCSTIVSWSAGDSLSC